MKIVVDCMPYYKDDCLFCDNGYCNLSKCNAKCEIGYWSEDKELDEYIRTPEKCDYLVEAKI